MQCGTASPQRLLGDDMFPQAARCTEERRAERAGGRRRQRETGRMTPLPAGVCERERGRERGGRQGWREREGHPCIYIYYLKIMYNVPYSGYFWGGKIFGFFVVER